MVGGSLAFSSRPLLADSPCSRTARRQIAQGLLSWGSVNEPKVRTRLLFESIVIVGSILLAFAIDAAWSELQDRRLETEYLHALASEAGENIAQVRRSPGPADLAMSALVRAEQLLAAGAAGDGAAVLVQSLLQGLYFSGTAARSTAVMDDLMGTHGLGIIRSDELRRSILQDHSTVDAFSFRAGYLGESVSPGLQRLISRWVPQGYSGIQGGPVPGETWPLTKTCVAWPRGWLRTRDCLARFGRSLGGSSCSVLTSIARYLRIARSGSCWKAGARRRSARPLFDGVGQESPVESGVEHGYLTSDRYCHELPIRQGGWRLCLVSGQLVRQNRETLGS